VHTFKTFTFTCGFGAGASWARHMLATAATPIIASILLRTTAF
jgi:hypothetical protein